jgi:hypothetical protein
LALLVIGWEIIFLLAVRNGYDIGRLVNATLEWLVIPDDWIWIRIFWIDLGISLFYVSSNQRKAAYLSIYCFSKSGIGTVRSIDSIKEGVQEPTAILQTLGICQIISLKDNTILWVDDRVRYLEIEVGFSASNR